MRNFTGEYVQQRGRVSSRTPASSSKKCWTCHGDHLQRNCPDFAPGLTKGQDPAIENRPQKK